MANIQGGGGGGGGGTQPRGEILGFPPCTSLLYIQYCIYMEVLGSNNEVLEFQSKSTIPRHNFFKLLFRV